MNELSRIVDYFTDQQQTRVFHGFDVRGKALLSEPMASPLSFAHDDGADHEGPLQRGCDSCFLINAARQLPSLKKAAARNLIREMRQALARFGDENPAATEDITGILKRVEAGL